MPVYRLFKGVWIGYKGTINEGEGENLRKEGGKEVFNRRIINNVKRNFRLMNEIEKGGNFEWLTCNSKGWKLLKTLGIGGGMKMDKRFAVN